MSGDDWNINNASSGSVSAGNEIINDFVTPTSANGQTILSGDTTSTSDGVRGHHYRQLPDNPLLETPDDRLFHNDENPNESDDNPSGNTSPFGVGTPTDGYDVTEEQQVYSDAFNAALNRMNLTPEQIGELNFLRLNPDATVDPSITALYDQAVASATQSMISQYNLSSTWQPPVQSAENFAIYYQSALEVVLQKAQDSAANSSTPLSDQDLQNLEFAFMHPDKATAAQKQQLASLGIADALTAKLQSKGFSVPSGWTVDTSQYDASLQSTADSQYETALNAYAQANNLSQQDVQYLKTAYYLPSNITLPASLQQVYTQLTSNVATKMPPGWGPSNPDPSEYSITMSHDYSFQIQRAVSAYESANVMTSDEQEQLQFALDPSSNTSNVAISPSIQEVANNIMANVMAAIQSTYGVNGTWQPTAVNTIPTYQYARNATNTLSSMQTIIQKYINKLPDGPDKMSMVNFMTVVMNALNQLNETLYRMEAQESLGATRTALSQQETTAFQISKRFDQMKQQAAQQAEMRKGQQKSAGLRTFLKVITPIAALAALALTVVTAGAIGPLAAAIVVSLAAMAFVDATSSSFGGPSFMSAVMAAPGQLFAAMGISHPLADFLGKVLAFVVIVAATHGTGSLMAGSEFLGQSNAFGDLATTCGASPMTSAIISGVMGAVCTVGPIMALSVRRALSKAKFIEEAEANIAKFTRLSEQAEKTGSTLAKKYYDFQIRWNTRALDSLFDATKALGVKGLGVMTTITNTSASTLSGMANYIDYQTQLVMARMKELNAEFDSTDATLSDLIAALKAEVNKLEAIIQQIVTQIASVGKVENSMWTQLAIPYPGMARPG